MHHLFFRNRVQLPNVRASAESEHSRISLRSIVTARERDFVLNRDARDTALTAHQ